MPAFVYLATSGQFRLADCMTWMGSERSLHTRRRHIFGNYTESIIWQGDTVQRSFPGDTFSFKSVCRQQSPIQLETLKLVVVASGRSSSLQSQFDPTTAQLNVQYGLGNTGPSPIYINSASK